MQKEIVMYKEDWEQLIKNIDNENSRFKQQLEVNELVLTAMRNKAPTAPPKPIIKPKDK